MTDPNSFDAAEKAAVYRAIFERRDIRHFRSDPLPDEVIERLLLAAHHAGSVGFMQPWNFILIRDVAKRQEIKALVEKERRATAAAFGPQRGERFLALKVEGILEAPLNLCVTTDPTRGGPHVLGRHCQPETDVYSTCLAVQNLWLAARAEGIGVGWVSIIEKQDLRKALGMPQHIIPLAYLCIGYPLEFPPKPLLEIVGWEKRRELRSLVFNESWGATPNWSNALRELSDVNKQGLL